MHTGNSTSSTTRLPLVFLVLAIISGVVGFMGLESGTLDGLGKAMFGVFFILFYIALFFGRES